MQLPPVDENQDNHLLDSPHARLTEIMRQAAESEIIRVSADIRLGRPLKPFKGKEVQYPPGTVIEYKLNDNLDLGINEAQLLSILS